MKRKTEPRGLGALRWTRTADRRRTHQRRDLRLPARRVRRLRDASPEQLAEIEVSAAGFGLHWPQLDEDYTVKGLMNGVFGTAKWMAAQAGRTSSPAKAAAARANGAKGREAAEGGVI